MEKYIVLSVNDNPDYLYYTPLTCWAWRKFGWEPILMFHGKMTPFIDWVLYGDGRTCWDIEVKDIEGYRSDTITQVSRLYAASGTDGLLMTGDIDMIPLSDYWHPDPENITIYGHDLTGYGQYPICYIAMKAERWREVMNLPHPNDKLTGKTTDGYYELIKRDLDTMPQAKDPDFYKYWFTDQELITQKINNTQFSKQIINRGQYKNGYAVGRVDRGAWSLEHDQFIDAHLLRDIYKKPENLNATLDLLYKIWPDEDFTWFVNYTIGYKKRLS